MTSIHPFDFESVEPPSKSLEQLLGIESVYKEASADFFNERFNLQTPPNVEINLLLDPKEYSPLKARSVAAEQTMSLPSGSKKLTSHIASISSFDLVPNPTRFGSNQQDSNSRDIEASQDKKNAAANEGEDDKRKVTDKWGFVVEDPAELANSASRGNTKSQSKLEDKWLDIRKDWASFSEEKRRRIFKKRFRKGIPNRIRGEMWKMVLDVAEIRNENRDLFQRLLDETSEFEGQIQRDINRTLPRHIFFQERGGMGQTSLFNALKAYAVYDKKVGYCQGMGFIMAMFLLYMTEEDAFFLLAQLIKKNDMSGLFEPGFPALIQCFYVHDQLFHQMLPRLAAHFESQMIAASMYATQWYTTVFAISLPFEFTIRIWDLFLVDGFKILYRAALAILRLMQKDLIRVEFEGIMDRVRNINKYLTITPDEFITTMMELKITTKRLNKLSKEFSAGQVPAHGSDRQNWQ